MTSMLEWVLDEIADGHRSPLSLIVTAKPIEVNLSKAGVRVEVELVTFKVQSGLWQTGIGFPTHDSLSWKTFGGNGLGAYSPNPDINQQIAWIGQRFNMIKQILLVELSQAHQNLDVKIAATKEAELAELAERAEKRDDWPLFHHLHLQSEADRLTTCISLLQQFTDLDDYVPDLPLPASP